MKCSFIFAWKVAALFMAFILLAYSPSFGSGFALAEQGVSGLGNAFAGGAASAEDATTIFYNPAGMTKLDNSEFMAGAHIIIPSAKFKNEGSIAYNPAIPAPSPPFSVLVGDNGGEGGATRVAPNLYYTRKLRDRLSFGLGVNSPFGLATEYNNTWAGRYHAIKSDLFTVNINPALAYEVNDYFSLGCGLSAQYLEAELSNAVDFGLLDTMGTFPVSLGLNPQEADGFVNLEGDSWGYGFNLGALVSFNQNTRMGAAYRSSVRQEIEGTARYTNIPAGLPLPSSKGAKATIKLPDTLSLGVYHTINKRLAFMADITWTNWSMFDNLVFDFEDGLHNTTIEAWKDSFRYSAGLTYLLNCRWTIRAGMAYDETPVPDPQHRTPRIPCNNRTWLACGFGYKFSSSLSIDAGYAHIFVKDPVIDKTGSFTGYSDETIRGGLKGAFDASVDILSAQLRWVF